MPLQVELAQQQIRERLGDQTLTLLVHAVTTVDVTAKGRILLGDAHFATLDAEQAKLQSSLEDLGRVELQRMSNTFVNAVDAALRADAWVVRAQIESPRLPHPEEIAAVEEKLAALAQQSVTLSVWASTNLIVTARGYDSVDALVTAEVARRRAAREAPAVSEEARGAIPANE